MVYHCVYNPKEDIMLPEQKDPSEYDIKVMLNSGVVSGENSLSSSEFNGISDPKRIIGRVANSFQAIDAQEAIAKAGQISAGNE